MTTKKLVWVFCFLLFPLCFLLHRQFWFSPRSGVSWILQYFIYSFSHFFCIAAFLTSRLGTATCMREFALKRQESVGRSAEHAAQEEHHPTSNGLSKNRPPPSKSGTWRHESCLLQQVPCGGDNRNSTILDNYRGMVSVSFLLEFHKMRFFRLGNIS